MDDGTKRLIMSYQIQGLVVETVYGNEVQEACERALRNLTGVRGLVAESIRFRVEEWDKGENNG